MTLIIEATRYKKGEQYHEVISNYVKSIEEVWLPNHAIGISKGYPGIAYKSDSALIKAQLFEIEDSDTEDYKRCLSNRHITWEVIPEVYDSKGSSIKNVLAPVLKPINSIFSVAPIYHLTTEVQEWTEKSNAAYLLEIERNNRIKQWDNIPTAMEI